MILPTMESENVITAVMKEITGSDFPMQLYNDLRKDMIGTVEEWTILKQLNSLSVEQYDLLDWAAHGFFFTVRRSLFQGVVVGTMRLLDTKTYRDNHKTMYRLLNEIELSVEDDELKRRIQEFRQQLKSIEESAKPVMNFRHNFIAHSALKPAITQVETAAIDSVIQSLWEFLNIIRITFTGVTGPGIELTLPGDLNTLVDRLSQLPDWGVKFEELKQIDGWYKDR